MGDATGLYRVLMKEEEEIERDEELRRAYKQGYEEGAKSEREINPLALREQCINKCLRADYVERKMKEVREAVIDKVIIILQNSLTTPDCVLCDGTFMQQLEKLREGEKQWD